jgi:hypothetical protein
VAVALEGRSADDTHLDLDLAAGLPACTLLLFPISAAPLWGVGEVGNAPRQRLLRVASSAPARGHSGRTRSGGVVLVLRPLLKTVGGHR